MKSILIGTFFNKLNKQHCRINTVSTSPFPYTPVMGHNAKARMHEFLGGNLREDATLFEKCAQTRDTKAFEGRAPSSGIIPSWLLINMLKHFPKWLRFREDIGIES